MSDTRVIISEFKDGSGRRYSVTRAARDELYPDFYTEGEETPADFIVTGIPAPKAKRAHARKKAAAPIPKAPIAAPIEPAPSDPPTE